MIDYNEDMKEPELHKVDENLYAVHCTDGFIVKREYDLAITIFKYEVLKYQSYLKKLNGK